LAGYTNKAFACPYYKWDERQRVTCEGGVSVPFPDYRTACEYMDRYCANVAGWHGCSIAAALEGFYERKDDET